MNIEGLPANCIDPSNRTTLFPAPGTDPTLRRDYFK